MSTLMKSQSLVPLQLFPFPRPQLPPHQKTSRERKRELCREGGKSLLAYVKGVGPYLIKKHRIHVPNLPCCFFHTGILKTAQLTMLNSSRLTKPDQQITAVYSSPPPGKSTVAMHDSTRTKACIFQPQFLLLLVKKLPLLSMRLFLHAMICHSNVP